MQKTKLHVKDLSQHLFWDVDINKLTIDENEKLIVKRVLDYGLMEDWLKIRDYYGIDKISKTAQSIRDLEKKSASFIATISNTPKESFLCYTTTPSHQKHWNF